MSIFTKIKDTIFGKKDVVAGGAAVDAAGNVDIDAVLTTLAASSGQTLNWKTSIVDLMKLVGMDSSLGQRQELAKELGYTGDMNDSASMNIWLHKQVMTQMAANGGKVPPNMMS
jgi:hypothetical protein